MKTKIPYIKYIVAMMIYGSNGVIASHIDLSSMVIVYLRSVIGAIVLCIFYLMRNCHKKDSITVELPPLKEYIFVALSGIAMAFDWLLLFEAYQRIGVGISIVINYTAPIIIVGLAPIVLRERIVLRKLIALTSSFVGVTLISSSAFIMNMDGKGLIMAILSIFAFAALILLDKQATIMSGVSNATFQLVCAALTVTVIMAVRGELLVTIPSGELIYVLWLGIINSAIGCYLCFSALSQIPAQTVAVYGYIEPMSAVLFSLVFLKETMLPQQWLGTILIIGGALFVELHSTSNVL